MNEKQSNPLLNLALPELNKPKDVINGKAAPKYSPVFVVQLIFCQNCKMPLTPNGLAWTTSFPQLQDLAESLHASGVAANKTLCTKPQILFTYLNGFMLSSMMK